MIWTKKRPTIIKLTLPSNGKTLDAKISTVLGQRRLNSSEIFSTIKSKISDLSIRQDVTVLLQVLIVVMDVDKYFVYLKMPSLTNLINFSLQATKNFDLPGYFLQKRKLTLTLTPYMVFEISRLKLMYDNIHTTSIRSHYKKHLSSLKSKGVNLYTNE